MGKILPLAQNDDGSVTDSPFPHGRRLLNGGGSGHPPPLHHLPRLAGPPWRRCPHALVRVADAWPGLCKARRGACRVVLAHSASGGWDRSAKVLIMCRLFGQRIGLYFASNWSRRNDEHIVHDGPINGLPHDEQTFDGAMISICLTHRLLLPGLQELGPAGGAMALPDAKAALPRRSSSAFI